MLSLARLSIQRPKAALAVWLIVAAALSTIGFGVSGVLSPSITTVPGTQSYRAQRLANAQFGPSQLVPILLEGPRAQLDHQGPALVAALRHRPHARVLSAWDTGTASAGLRPRATAAMIVVAIDRTEKAVVTSDQPQIERLVARQITPPVRSYVTGQPSIDRALKTAAVTDLRQTELLAVAVLLVLLLIGLRAPVAALLVTAVGAISTLAAFGEVALLGHILTLDPVGVALGTMTGLAIGVGFALLIVDRFHRELDRGGHRPQAAATAAITDLQVTGRAVLIGGTALVVALALVAVIGPTALLVSLGTGMLTCAAFATGGAVVVMPAALVLLGRRLDAFRLPTPAPLQRAWSRLVGGGGWVAEHAIAAGFFATLGLALLAVPAFALHSGPPTVTQLPAGAPARIAFERVSQVMGPGWATPYDVIVVANGRPITTPSVLAGVRRLERQIAAIPTVDSVAGPGAIDATAAQLKAFGPSLARSAKISDRSKKQLLTLINGLGQAGAGSAELRSGLVTAASGAGRLQAGSGTATSGAGRLHAGLATAKAGSATLAAGLTTALAGARALKTGADQAVTGSSQLLQGVDLARGPAGQSLPALQSLAKLTADSSSAAGSAQTQAQTAANQAQTALSALQAMTSGRSDPHYGAALAALQSANGAIAGASTQIATAASRDAGAKGLAASIVYQAPGLVAALNLLRTGAAQLQSGIARLRNGNAQLAGGLRRLAGGGGQLKTGLGQLTEGAGALEAGLGQLTTGTGQLASGLAGAPGPAGQLTAGLGTMQAAVTKARGQIPSTKDLARLRAESPGIFSSGYFVLSAVAGARPADRNAASFTINLQRGGNAGQIVVVSKYAANDGRAQALADRLARLGSAFARRQNAQVAVGGPAGSLRDLTGTTRSRIWLDVAVLAVALALVLALALRALLLAAAATVFSLLVTAAAFGVLQLLFGGGDPLLGGPGYMDPMSIIGVFTVVFGVSIVYSALLLVQTRAIFVSRPGVREAVLRGLSESAAPATGAALVMVAALAPFMTTDLINLRQFGIGVAVAILLEMLIARPVLLPAAEAVFGRAGWWPTRPAAIPPSAPADPPPFLDAIPAPAAREPATANHA
ncbi:MAG TPA: MMPL family transporter [Solirubrobacteraceae bacterium]|nr:MMPL family transporter [Solirubrobacteraceae bacterium]